MAVEDAQAPRRKDEESGAREEDPRELNREVAPLARESSGNQGNQEWREEHTGKHDDCGREGESYRHYAGKPVRFLLFVAAEETGIFGNEGRRENAFAKQILQQVGNPDGGVERVGGERAAEVEREDLVPDEPGYATEKNPGAHEESSAT